MKLSKRILKSKINSDDEYMVYYFNLAMKQISQEVKQIEKRENLLLNLDKVSYYILHHYDEDNIPAQTRWEQYYKLRKQLGLTK